MPQITNITDYLFIKLKRTRPFTFIVLGISILVLALGLYLRCKLYFMDRGLWVDEAVTWARMFALSSPLDALSMNFRSTIGRPLGFFFFSKLLVQIFNDSEIIVRLVAFIPSILILFFTFFSGRLFFKTKPVILLPLCIITAFSYEFISSTCHYKHYMLEAFVSIYLITITALYFRSKSIIALSFALVSASLSLFFGNNAYLISPLVFLACLLQLKIDKKHIITFCLCGIFGAAVAGWVYFSYIHGHTSGLNTLFQRPFLNSYYQGTDGILGYLAWAGNQFYNLVDHLLLNKHSIYIKQHFDALSIPAALLFTLLSLLGALYFIVHREPIGLVIAGPFLSLYIFNLFGVFPIGAGRWSAHLTINLAFMVGFGLKFLYSWLGKRNLGKVAFTFSILTALLLLPPTDLLKEKYWIPYKITTRYLKSMLEDIRLEHQNENDVPSTVVHFVASASGAGYYYLHSDAYKRRYRFLQSKSGPYTIWNTIGLGPRPEYEPALKQYREFLREDNRRKLFLLSHGNPNVFEAIKDAMKLEKIESSNKIYPHGIVIEITGR